MWWVQRPEVVLYWAPTAAWLLTRPRLGGPWSSEGWIPAEELTSRLKEAVRGRARLRVLLSTSLCQFLALPSVDGLKGRQERERAAKAAALALLDGEPDDWVFSFIAMSQGRVMACAVSSAVDRRVRGTALEASHELVSICPWITSALDASSYRRNPAHSLMVDEPDALSLIKCGEDGSINVATLPVRNSDERHRAADMLGPTATSVMLVVELNKRSLPFQVVDATGQAG